MALDYFTAEEAIDEARAVYLNDTAGGRYTDARMFELFKSSLDIILLKLVESEVPFTKTTIRISAIPAAVTVVPLETGDLTHPIVPIRVKERQNGTTLWTPMIEQSWVPSNLTAGPLRTYWRWGLAGNAPTVTPVATIEVPAGTVVSDFDVDCRIATPEVPDATTTIRLPGLRSYFAARLAALGATFIGNNPTRGQQCEAIAQTILDAYLNIHGKKNQSIPARRLPFNYLKRSGWRFWR